MCEKQGKIRTIHLPRELTPEQEAKQLAAYQRAQAKAQAREEERRRSQQEQDREISKADFDILNQEDFAALAESPRRRAREGALLLLYQVQYGGCPWDTASQILVDIGITGEYAEFASTLAEQAAADSERSDALLSLYARDWDVERFSQVDRTILRLAVSEMLHDPQMATVIINEGVELGKKFGGDDSGSFINALLDNIRKHDLPQTDKGQEEPV